MDVFETIDAVPVLNVTNFTDAIDFYTRVLGFEKVFEIGEYSGLALGGIEIHVNGELDEWSSLPTSARINVHGIDAYHEKVRALGSIKPDEPLQDMPFGVRQFSILDPAGNRITFCEAIK